MIYKDFLGKKVSTLGMGVMRLPTTEDGKINDTEAAKLVDHAYKNGVNYFDTGYFYHSGDSERFIGEALRKYPRDSWFLANKIPGNTMRKVDGKIELSGIGDTPWMINGPADLFEYQIDKCGVDYFDFYLLHNLSENSYDIYTDEELGIVDYLIKQKEAGRIKHIGFSTHGRTETIEAYLKHLESKGQLKHIEFAMVQINYLDMSLQDADKKYELLTKYGLPVLAMEPTRGGKLCNLGGMAGDILKAARPDFSQAAWCFRFLQSMENMQIVISGMSNMEQLEENLALFSEKIELTTADFDAIERAVEALADFVPCTDCKYCIDACPQGLNIPLLMTLYNEANYEVAWMLRASLRGLGDKTPEACVMCGLCSPLCPQNIDIPQVLKKFDELVGASS